MSRYDVVVNGTPITVEILAVADGRATVSVNGSTFQVKLPNGAAAQPNRTLRTPQAPPPAPAQAAPQQPRPASPTERVPRPAPPPQAAPQAQKVQGEEILAPMPGSVVKVLVRAGDEVSVGSPVVLMEAMKMENEICSHVAGKIAAVRVGDGQTVRVNDVLVVVSK